MSTETDTQTGEKVYLVTPHAAAENRGEEVTARNAGEAVWLVHARNGDPSGTAYTVAPVDQTEPARNFTVGHPRQEAPFSD